MEPVRRYCGAVRAPIDLGLDYAGTMFSTIRQRWNMNMVRLPISVTRSERDRAYILHVTELIRRANERARSGGGERTGYLLDPRGRRGGAKRGRRIPSALDSDPGD